MTTVFLDVVVPKKNFTDAFLTVADNVT